MRAEGDILGCLESSALLSGRHRKSQTSGSGLLVVSIGLVNVAARELTETRRWRVEVPRGPSSAVAADSLPAQAPPRPMPRLRLTNKCKLTTSPSTIHSPTVGLTQEPAMLLPLANQYHERATRSTRRHDTRSCTRASTLNASGRSWQTGSGHEWHTRRIPRRRIQVERTRWLWR